MANMVQSDKDEIKGVGREITLLIPTMDRPEYLIRLLGYYAGLRFTGRIRIGDSSDPENFERIRQAVQEFTPTLNIEHESCVGLGQPACLELLARSISTPYAAYIADDDFIVPSAVSECVRFLESHTDYIAAHGVGAVIRLASAGPYGKVVRAYSYRQASVEETTGAQRLLEYLASYSVSQFSVYRAAYFVKNFGDVSGVSDKTFAGELLPGCLTAVQGKIKALDSLFLVRQAHQHRNLLPDTFDWLHRPDWLPSYQTFRDRLADELARQDQITSDQAADVVKQALRRYLAAGLNKQWQGRYGQARWLPTIRASIGGTLALRQTWHRIRSVFPGQERLMLLPGLLRSRSPYHENFFPIYRAVTRAQGS